jgi:hypothetical protein
VGSHWSYYAKKKCICTCVLFRTVPEIELFHCTVQKLLIRKRYYVLFLILVFIVQVTKFSKIPPSTTMHSETRVRTWRVVRLHSGIARSRKPFGIGHTYIYIFLLRKTDTVTSLNTDLSSWHTLCNHTHITVVNGSAEECAVPQDVYMYRVEGT